MTSYGKANHCRLYPNTPEATVFISLYFSVRVCTHWRVTMNILFPVQCVCCLINLEKLNVCFYIIIVQCIRTLTCRLLTSLTSPPFRSFTAFFFLATLNLTSRQYLDGSPFFKKYDFSFCLLLPQSIWMLNYLHQYYIC